MSDSESTSSGETSLRRFRPSPVSDTESVVSTTWKRPPAALHPSASQVFESSSKYRVLDPPRGFGAQSTSPAPSQHAPSTASSSHHYHPTRSHSFEDFDSPRRSKGKEKERPRQQSKEAPGKGKERDKGTPNQHASQTVALHPSQSTFGQAPPDATKKSFRIHAYSNDPSAGATIHVPQQGPYGAAYRAESGKRGSSKEEKSRHQRAPPPQSVPGPQPRSSHYRYDYDKVRESAPANRAKQAAETATHHPSTQNHGATSHQAHSYSTPAPTPSSEDRHRSSRSTKRKGTDMYTAHQSYHPPDQYYGDAQGPPPNHFDSATPPPQPQYIAPEIAPGPAPPKERRHKSRSHRHEQPHYPAQAPPPAPAPAQSQPPPYSGSTTRVIRTLTLLIEDQRSGHEDNILAEVKVPFKQMSGSDAAWADAQDVTNELQNGASRIDGAAKLYTMRGKWKQYFFRIAANGEQICPSANLQVTPERTLEIVVEDNPPPPGMTHAPLSSPPRVERELLTPITDSMASPSPAPMQLHGHKRASKSSLFSIDDQLSPVDRQSFDGSSYMYGVNKRPRSSSIQSMQSVASDAHLQPSKRDSYSPMDYRSTSAKPSAASHSRTPSQSSLPPQIHHPEPPQMQMSPVSPPPEPTPEPEPPQRSGSWSFPQLQAKPSFSSSSSSSVKPGPSPPKKAKLALPQVHQHTEHSVSPGPSQPASYPWSHSRTSSAGSMSGFAAYAGTRKPSGTSQPASNAFAKYDSGAFSLPAPKSEASITPAAQANITLPTALSMPVVPSITPSSLSSSAPTPPPQTHEPATIAPGAISITPTLSGQVSSDLDNAVGRYVRAIIDKEPEWTVFVENRKRVLKAGEQLAQYAYVQAVIDRFTGTATPADLEGAGAVAITKAQVMRAFNLPLAWGDECTETLRLTALYGPGGTRGEDERVVRMLDAPPAITTKTTAKMFLDLLREVDRQRTAGPSQPTTEPPRAKEPQWQLRA